MTTERTRVSRVGMQLCTEDSRSNDFRKIGAEVAVADMYDPEQLLEAARGTQRAYYLPLMQPYMIQAANAFAVAAQEAKLESIVQMSQWTSSASHPTAMTRQTWLIDRNFSMIPGVAHIIFNPGMFAYNFLVTVDFASLLGIFPVLMGDSQSAPISNEDMARAAAALLMQDPAVHAGKSYRPTGPVLLSARDMAKIVVKVVGHGVVPVSLPLCLFRKVARMQKVDPYQIALLLQYIKDNKQGTFFYEGGVTTVMQELTGKSAESFETTARRYASMPFAQQTLANRVRAIVNFAITPLHPGHDIKAYEKALQLPVPVKPLRCMEVAGEHRRVALAALAEHLEEQLGAGLGQRLLKPSESGRPYLEELYRRCPEIAITARVAQEFFRIVQQRDLPAWARWREAARHTPLASFARHLCRDEAAVMAALEHKWSNGPVEGNVTASN